MKGSAESAMVTEQLDKNAECSVVLTAGCLMPAGMDERLAAASAVLDSGVTAERKYGDEWEGDSLNLSAVNSSAYSLCNAELCLPADNSDGTLVYSGKYSVTAWRSGVALHLECWLTFKVELIDKVELSMSYKDGGLKYLADAHPAELVGEP